jgi:hypothetical protein
VGSRRCVRLSAPVLLNFSLYIIFLRHIINILPSKFSSPTAVLPILIPYTFTITIKYYYLTLLIFYYYFVQLLNRGALCKWTLQCSP